MTQISASGTAYELQGAKSAPVVVLIHGLGLTRGITWQAFIEPLSASFRVLSYDLCGHGESALPDTTPSLTLLAEQLRDLLDELGIEHAALVGFSLGGMINRRFAMLYPNRVSALVVLNSPHERDPQQQRLVEERAAKTGTSGIVSTIDTTLDRWFTEDFLALSSVVVSEVRSTVLSNNLTNYTQHRQVLASGVLELIRPDPRLTQDCLVITCEFDSGSTPEMSYAIASEIVGAEVLIIERLQHLGLLEKPERFIEPIGSFLQRCLKLTSQSGL